MNLTGDFMGAPADIRLRVRGWMFGLAELGADYGVSPRFAVGPVVGLSQQQRLGSSVTSTGVGCILPIV